MNETHQWFSNQRGRSLSIVQGVQLVRGVVVNSSAALAVLVEIVLKHRYLNTPPWPLSDLVSRSLRSTRFHIKLPQLIALQRFPLHTVLPGVQT